MGITFDSMQNMKPSKAQNSKPTIRFKAKLTGAFLILPKNASAKLPQSEATVEGMLNHLPFRAATQADIKGSYKLKMSDTTRVAIGANVGDTVSVEITRVGEEPELRVPSDLRKALAAIPSAKASWADITPMARRDWIFSICEAKQPETREHRIDKACDMLASGKRRLCCFPGVKWMMKENAKALGMWRALKSTKKH